MTPAARKITSLPVGHPADYLGPAPVTRVAPHELEVELRRGVRVLAEMALAFPYQAVVGDVLLVIGKGDQHYVIGVLHGSGRAALTLQGAVELRAEGGPLTLSSDHGVQVRGPAVQIEADKLELYSESVVQRCTSLTQRVAGTMDVRASDCHTIVDNESFLTAKNASIVTEENMTINGDEIHLG